IDGMVTGADRIVYNLGTNDAGQSAGNITAAVTARLNRDLSLAPTGIITVIAGFSTLGTTETAAIQAGVAAASDQTRVQFVDGHLWMSGTATQKKASDTVHPHQVGHTFLGRMVGNAVAN